MKTLEKDFMDHMSQMAKGFGLDDLAVRVFAVLYIEPEEVAMDEVARKTGYSLASISNTMKLLETMGAIRRIKKPGSRKIFFYMDKDLMKWNIMKLDYALNYTIKPAKQALPGIIKKYKTKVKEDDDKKKLEVVKGYLDQMLVFENLIIKWKKDLRKVQK